MTGLENSVTPILLRGEGNKESLSFILELSVGHFASQGVQNVNSINRDS